MRILGLKTPLAYVALKNWDSFLIFKRNVY
jgi:hypothetical protein